MTGSVIEGKTVTRFDVGASLVAAITLVFYALAWVHGASVRGARHLVFAAIAGWEDGRRGDHTITGRAIEKPKG